MPASEIERPWEFGGKPLPKAIPRQEVGGPRAETARGPDGGIGGTDRGHWEGAWRRAGRFSRVDTRSDDRLYPWRLHP